MKKITRELDVLTEIRRVVDLEAFALARLSASIALPSPVQFF